MNDAKIAKKILINKQKNLKLNPLNSFLPWNAVPMFQRFQIASCTVGSTMPDYLVSCSIAWSYTL